MEREGVGCPRCAMTTPNFKLQTPKGTALGFLEFGIWSLESTASGSFPRQPCGRERGVRQPADRLQHRPDGVGHVREVDEADLVLRRVVLLVKPVARDGVRDDAAARELDVVRAREKALFRVR